MLRVPMTEGRVAVHGEWSDEITSMKCGRCSRNNRGCAAQAGWGYTITARLRMALHCPQYGTHEARLWAWARAWARG